MICHLEHSKANKAESEFKEWASLFSGELFVKISIYVDESGTHDPTGKQPGSKFPTVAGFAARRYEWGRFCQHWKAILLKYGATYFHSRELRQAKSARENNKIETPELKNNPYYAWSLKRMDDFLFELARVAGAKGKIPLAGCIRLQAFNNLKAKLEVHNPDNIQLGTDPYIYCIGEFFRIYHEQTFMYWGEFNWPVTFFFDQSDNPEWRNAVHKVFDEYRKKDPRIKELVFADKKDDPHLPLQAADMLAYRLRQMSEKLSEKTYVHGESDLLLLRTLFHTAAKTNPALKPLLR